MEMKSFTERLSQFVIETPIANIPGPVFEGARNALMDTVGVALAGTIEPVSAITARWIQEVGGRPQATLWGGRFATSIADAAFANGICSHALDFDDTMPSLRGHPSATIIPAVLAVGEAIGARGEDVLAAYALGLEVAGKLGRVIGYGHYQRGWHTTATIGVLSSTAAVARLWGLGVDNLCLAFGLAASQIGGLILNFGTMAKPFHAGHAARCAVLSAWMAQAGLTANEQIFDGKGSVLSTYGGQDGTPLEDELEKLGLPWEMLNPGIYVKRWPCCHCNHRPIGGLLALMEQHQIRPEEVTQIAVGFLPGSDNALVSHNPQTGLEGKFSIEYCAAAALIDGELTLKSFTDAMVQRVEIRELMNKVQRYRIADDGVYSGIIGYTDVAVDTVRGCFKMHVDRVPGSPAWPLTVQDRTKKFISCAERVLDVPDVYQLLELIQNCQTLPDIRELVRATIPREKTGGLEHAKQTETCLLPTNKRL